MEVGTGKRDPNDHPCISSSQDRRQAGFSAPAQGSVCCGTYESRKDYARHRRVADPALERERGNYPGTNYENNHLGTSRRYVEDASGTSGRDR